MALIDKLPGIFPAKHGMLSLLFIPQIRWILSKKYGLSAQYLAAWILICMIGLEVSADSQLISVVQPTKGHVISLIFSPNGKRLISTHWTALRGHKGYDAKVWDTSSWRYKRGLPKVFKVLNFSTDGRFMLTEDVSKTTSLRVWDTTQWKVLLKRQSNTSQNPSRLSPDGKRLAFIGEKSGDQELPTIFMQDVKSKKIVFRGSKYTSGIIAFLPQDWLAVEAMEVTDFRLVDLKTGWSKQKFTFSQEVFLALSPSKKLLATKIQSNDKKGEQIHIWDIASMKLLYTLPEIRSQIVNVDFSQNDKNLAVSSSDGNVSVWQIKSAKQLISVNTGLSKSGKYYRPIFALSPDATLLAIAKESDKNARSDNLEIWRISKN